jgi:hypothetical protein
MRRRLVSTDKKFTDTFTLPSWLSVQMPPRKGLWQLLESSIHHPTRFFRHHRTMQLLNKLVIFDKKEAVTTYLYLPTVTNSRRYWSGRETND